MTFRQVRYALLVAVSALVTGCAGLPETSVPFAPSFGARAIVFDIDGTLTPAVYAINEVRADAAAAVRAYSDEGYNIIYLSNRVIFLQNEIPAWLKQNDFPEGTIQVAQTGFDRSNPAVFKEHVLEEFLAHGWRLTGAYGDSSTDFKAYADAGISPDHVFALLRRGDTHCESGQWKACLPNWTVHLSFIENRAD